MSASHMRDAQDGSHMLVEIAAHSCRMPSGLRDRVARKPGASDSDTSVVVRHDAAGAHLHLDGCRHRTENDHVNVRPLCANIEIEKGDLSSGTADSCRY
jgi:hypothetical protein